LYNLPITSTQLQINRNGAICPVAICTNLTSMQAGNVTFNVTQGGNYTIVSNSSLPLVNLNLPVQSFNSTSKDINFNFTFQDDSAGNGNYIGKIMEIYLDENKGRVYGWLIKLDKKLAKKIGIKKILVKHEFVQSISNIMLVSERVHEHLENFTEGIN